MSRLVRGGQPATAPSQAAGELQTDRGDLKDALKK